MRQADRSEAVERIKELAPAGTSLRCILGRVAPSGMSRTLRVFYVDRDGELIDVTVLAARVLEQRTDKHGFLRVGGCGFDAGLHIVDALSHRVWGKSVVQGWRNKNPEGTYHWGGWF